MKTTKLIVATCIAMVAMAACRKDKTIGSINPLSEPTAVKLDESSLRPIPQKMFPVTGAEALKIVKKFKHLDENNPNAAQARLIEADSVLIDSATFVVEATLNYDFDYSVTGDEVAFEDLPEVTTAFTIPKSRLNNKISTNDLEAVYEEITTFINTQIDSTKKVAIVDIEAYEVGSNQVTFKAIPRIITLLTVAPYQCFVNPTSGYASVTSNLTPLASSAINFYLRNCVYPLTGCQGSFYTNAIGFSFDNINNNTAYSSALYYNYFPSPPVQPITWTDLAILSAAQVSTMRTNCVTLVQGNLALLSPQHTVVVANLNDAFIFNPNVPPSTIPNGLNKTYWSLTGTYGIPVGC